MYPTAYIVEQTGATRRQLHTWAQKGWLPSVPPGTGHARMWSQSDYDKVRLIMRFLNAGFNVNRAHTLTVAILKGGPVYSKGVRVRIGDSMWVVVKEI